MNIKFNKAEVGSHFVSGDINNTSQKLIQRRWKILKTLGKFCKAKSIEYIDHGKQEEYIITKGKKKLIIMVSGNQFDGGYLSVAEKEGKIEPKKKPDVPKGFCRRFIDTSKIKLDDNFLPIEGIHI